MTAPPNQVPGIIPAIWQIDPWQAAEVEIIINWLDIEIEKHAELRLPILAQVKGHRNREVRSYIKENIERYQETARLALYGNMPGYDEEPVEAVSQTLQKACKRPAQYVMLALLKPKPQGSNMKTLPTELNVPVPFLQSLLTTLIELERLHPNDDGDGVETLAGRIDLLISSINTVLLDEGVHPDQKLINAGFYNHLIPFLEIW